MSLEKSVYKEFEPVVAKFELINNDGKALEIFELFEPTLSNAVIKVKDDSGKHWEKNQSHGSIEVAHLFPRAVITKGDTLVISMPINNWGEPYILSGNFGTLFQQYGFFPAGRKYTAEFCTDYKTDMYGTRFFLNSNEVEFEVISANSEDSIVFGLYTHTYREITLDSGRVKCLVDFPDNTFTEYMSAECFSGGYEENFEKDQQNDNSILEIYKNFFDKYPDSNHIYDYHVLRKLCEKLFSGIYDYGNVIQFTSEYFKNPNLNRMFNNSVFLGWVSTFINR